MVGSAKSFRIHSAVEPLARFWPSYRTFQIFKDLTTTQWVMAKRFLYNACKTFDIKTALISRKTHWNLENTLISWKTHKTRKLPHATEKLILWLLPLCSWLKSWKIPYAVEKTHILEIIQCRWKTQTLETARLSWKTHTSETNLRSWKTQDLET